MTVSHNLWLKRARSMMIAALVTLVSGGCSLTTHEQDKQAAQNRWQHVRSDMKTQLARQQFEGGHIDTAIKTADEALQRDPENVEAYLVLSRCYVADGKLGAAQRAIETAARLKPDHPELPALQGLVAERSGRMEDALKYYRKARAEDDAQVEHLLAEAECLVALDRASEADKLLRDNLAAYDNNPSILALIAEISLSFGDPQQALQAYRSVMSSGQASETIEEQYALLAARQGHYTEALPVLSKLVQKKKAGASASTSTLRQLAICQMQTGKMEAARMTLHRLVEQDSDNVQSWLLYARAGMATSDSGMVIRGADNARRLAPDDPQVLLMNAYAGIERKDFDGARASLLKLLEVHKDNAMALCMLGSVEQKRGDLNAARQCFERALAVDPHCDWAKSALAQSPKPDTTDSDALEKSLVRSTDDTTGT